MIDILIGLTHLCPPWVSPQRPPIVCNIRRLCMFDILEIERIAPGVSRAVIDAPDIARAHQPGQFIILRAHEDGERIPLTVADKDAQAGTLTLVWQEVGVSTYYLGSMCAGERLQDMCGPLGTPTHIDK